MRPRPSSLLPLFILICLVTLVRIAYLLWWCPYNLIEDEAQYWVWAKHLSWSYYSKGPGIAWSIAATTGIYGDAEWAVRLPAVFGGAVGLFAIGGLVRDVARAAEHPRPAKLGLLAAACFAIVPFFQMSAVLVTIDGPLIACWALGTWMTWRALFARDQAAWILLGAAIGVGFLFKYTMLLMVPGILLAAYWNRSALALHPRSKLWAIAGAIIALLALVPVIIWNAQHDWVTVRHLLGHLGLAGGDMSISSDGGAGARKWFEWLPVWPIGLALMQVGLVGPLLLVGAIVSIRSLRAPSVPTDPGTIAMRTLAAISLPVIALYAIVAYIAEPEGNWPIVASVTLVPAAVLWRSGVWAWPHRTTTSSAAQSPLDGARPAHRGLRWLFTAGVLYGLLAIAPLHRADILANVVNRIVAIPSVTRVVSSLRKDRLPPAPIVLGRLVGAREQGLAVGKLMDELRAQTAVAGKGVGGRGLEPFVLAQHYGRASQMMYYAPWPESVDANGVSASRPLALCASPITGGRRSHFDFIPELDLSRNDLAGRPAIILSNDRPEVREVWDRLFERVVEYRSPSGSRRLPGENKRDRVAYLGFGYRPPAKPAPTAR